MTNQDVIVAYAFLEVFHTYCFAGCCIRFGVFATALKVVQFGDSNRGKITTDSLALCSGGFGNTCIELVTKIDYLLLCRIRCTSSRSIIYCLQISQCLVSDTQKAEPAFAHSKWIRSVNRTCYGSRSLCLGLRVMFHCVLKTVFAVCHGREVSRQNTFIRYFQVVELRHIESCLFIVRVNSIICISRTSGRHYYFRIWEHALVGYIQCPVTECTSHSGRNYDAGRICS